MNSLLCDSGPLIAAAVRRDAHHGACVRLLSSWCGQLVIPEPVLGETCNFLRNQVRNGPAHEATFLEAVTRADGAYEIVDPTAADRDRATEIARRFVTAPFGYVDAMIVAMAERLGVANIATVDYKFLGMASAVSRLKPLSFVLQES